MDTGVVRSSPLPVERQRLIMDVLRTRQTVKCSELAARLDVNVATIRRDLRQLASECGVRVHHGGASLGSHYDGLVLRERALEEKQEINLEAKRVIARKAGALIKDGESIALNAGSTVGLIAEFLPAGLTDLTVVTLALNVAFLVAPLPFVHLYLPGGHYRRSSHVLTGSSAEAALADIHCDRAFLGASAIDLEAGWTHPAYPEVRTNKLLLKISTKRYLVCDSSKFDTIAFARIAGLDCFDAMIVDEQFPAHYREWAEAKQIEII